MKSTMAAYPQAFLVVELQGLTIVDAHIFSERSPTEKFQEEVQRFCIFEEMVVSGGYHEAYQALDWRIREDKRFRALRNLPGLVEQRRQFAASYPHLKNAR